MFIGPKDPEIRFRQVEIKPNSAWLGFGWMAVGFLDIWCLSMLSKVMLGYQRNYVGSQLL